jgi:UDP-glucose 4-epimerase
MKNVLVTGACGFIGSHLVDALVEDNNVYCIDDESAVSNDVFYKNDKARYFKISITDYDAILPLFSGVDTVFHLAAESRIQTAIENPIYATQVNVIGTQNVLEASKNNKVGRVIYSSTSSAYGLQKEMPLKENMLVDCLNPYSATKVAAEYLCKVYNDLYGVKTITFRYFNVFGERMPTKGMYAPVIGIFLKQRKNKLNLTIVGDGKQKRDFVYVGDVVKANICAALATNESCGNVFNVGRGKNISVLEIAKLISDNYEFLPKRPGEAHETLADIAKIRKYLDWMPKVNVEDWIISQL